MSETLVYEIQALRERLHLTKRQLASVLGVSGRTVHRWERGEGSPHEIYLERMRALVDAKELGGTDGLIGTLDVDGDLDEAVVPGDRHGDEVAGADAVGDQKAAADAGEAE